MALINRLTSQIAIFYIASPFILLGALALLAHAIDPMMMAFVTAYEYWLRTGGAVE